MDQGAVGERTVTIDERIENAWTEGAKPMNVAKLPPQFTRKAPRRLSDLLLGEEGAIEFTGMLVDAEGPCHVNPEAKLQDNSVPWSLIYVVCGSRKIRSD
jgi:hypothetical protein